VRWAVGMLNYTGNTVYLDVHKDVFLSDVTIYVASWSDRSGVFNHAGVLKIAAMIYWPDYGGYICIKRCLGRCGSEVNYEV
jgi:hypothetical protein